MAEIDAWFVFFDHDTPLLDFHFETLRPHETILHLLKKIKAGDYEGPIVNAKISDIEVWKFKCLKLHPLDEQMVELLSNLKLTDNEESDVELVNVRNRMGDLRLNEYEPLLVRVLQKAKRKPEDDYLDGARQCKLARLEPSKANSASVYEKLQESQEDRILDDCPKPDSDIPPLPLLYRGFGEFHDFIMNSANNPDAFSDDLETKVDELMHAMCHLGYEKDKWAKTQDLLHHIFGGPQRKFKYNVDNGTQASTDGYVSASHGGPLLIIEFKRQIAFSEAQLANYFLRICLNSVPDVFYGWRQPALGIVLRGTLISFIGLVMVDSQIRVLHLSRPFVSNDSGLGDRILLYATFEAARRLLVRIEEDAVRLVPSPPPAISGPRRRFPNVNNLLRVSGNNGPVRERMGFQITQKLETGLEGQRLLYLATTDRDQEQILVKFSRRYSKDLHNFCASIKHAPELLAFEKLPGGWFGVAMQYLPSAHRILESERLRDYGENWLKNIDNVVEEFHANGYVHGDLRPPNFIVYGDRLFLVDFDWGGKEGVATFPRQQLHSILRDSRRDEHITKGHDMRVKEYTKRLISYEIKWARVRCEVPPSSL